MPVVIDPIAVEVMSQFLRSQAEAAVDRISTLTTTLPIEHPGRAEELEALQDYWSSVSAEWSRVRVAWLLANTPDDFDFPDIS